MRDVLFVAVQCRTHLKELGSGRQTHLRWGRAGDAGRITQQGICAAESISRRGES